MRIKSFNESIISQFPGYKSVTAAINRKHNSATHRNWKHVPVWKHEHWYHVTVNGATNGCL